MGTHLVHNDTGLMEEVVAEGAVLLITSNRHPTQLTNHGLHEVR